MYYIRDKSSAIKAIQRMLGLAPSGIYDKRTRGAVTELQREYGLNADGTVDYKTFLQIVDYRNRSIVDRLGDESLLNRFPYVMGMYGEDVGLINLKLSRVLKEYRYDSVLPRGKIFNDASLRAQKRLREIFNIPDADFIDEELYIRLERESFSII